MGNLILETFRLKGKQETIESLDRLKEMGFDMATKAGISIGIFDMIIPPEKKSVLMWPVRRSIKSKTSSEKELSPVEKDITKLLMSGLRNDDIAKEVFKSLDENLGKDTINPVFLMMDSELEEIVSRFVSFAVCVA